ncbi:MAG TPA: NfeD family protein [Planctomycetota bacterium]|nr:NfeD family protein [Planctomycetota bacterium]
MAMEVVDVVYLVSFFLGLGFAVVSALMSGVFSGGADAHVGAGHDVHATAGDSVHFPLLSPVTLAMFVASFGGSGYIYKHALLLDPALHVALAAATAVVVALAVAWLFYKIFKATQGSSEAKVADLVGTEAEIITAIPADGMGEIAYVAMQTRYNGPARTPDGKPLPARTTVKIVRMVSGTFIVERVR